MSLQQRIHEAMRRRPSLSQADIARACKVKTPSVTDWLKGDTKTLRSETARLAGLLFGCDPHWLATGVGVPGWHEPGTHAQVQVTAADLPSPGASTDRLRLLGELFDLIPRLPQEDLALIYMSVKNAADSAPAPTHEPGHALSAPRDADLAHPRR